MGADDRGIDGSAPARRVMVDLQTAMAAAAAERQQRLDKTAEERKKRRSGADLGIERFDPVEYVSREKAETASMWLVLTFATLVALATRYVLMGWVGPGEGFLLWFLPISMLGLLPALHRAVMPETMVAHYKGTTWFKASFLHTFTFLALAFLLVNPPFGDITAASLEGDWRLAVVGEDGSMVLSDRTEAVTGLGTDDLVWITTDGVLDGQVWLVFGLTDNAEVEDDAVTVTVNDLPVSATLVAPESVTNLTQHDTVPRWVMVPVGEDLGRGTYDIEVNIVEEGSPWTNERVYSWSLEVRKAEG